MESIADEGVVQAFTYVVITRYVTAAAIVVLIYDHLLSFGDEVKLIWPAKTSAPKVLFLFIRYMVPTVLIIYNIQLSDLEPSLTFPTAFCVSWMSIGAFMALSTIATSNFLIMLRLWVLWDRDRKLVIWTLLLFVLAQLSGLATVSILVWEFKRKLDFNPKFHMCGFVGKPPPVAILWAPGTAFEIVLCAITWFNVLKRPRTSNASLATAMYRDGFLYFLLLLCLRIINTILAVKAPPALIFIAMFPVWCATTTTTCRLMIKLRQIDHNHDQIRPNDHSDDTLCVHDEFDELRPHNPDPSTSVHNETKRQLQTPDNTPNPKRPRTSIIAFDGDGNKENVPPFNADAVASPSSPRASRLRRTPTSDGSPTRARQSISRRASTSAIVPATPTAEIAQLSLATPPPTPPNSLIPIHVRARALLRGTCNSAAAEMAGRDSERAAITAFFASLIDEVDNVEHTSLYISGSPGSGKTALVNSILRTLDDNHVKVVTINCMALNSVDVLWERLVEELGTTPDKKRKTAGRAKKLQGRDAVEALLSVFPTKCIIILDELDHIAPNTQSLTSLLSISAARPSTLRVVGIANTHTLTASSSAGFMPSSSHVRTIHFAPYTPAQLLQILQSRLAPLYVSDASEDAESAESASQAAKRFLSPPALNLLTKKIAALTGDVRSLFEVLRGAIDLAVASPSSTPSPSPTRAEENPLNPKTKSAISPAHILAALKAYGPSTPAATGATGAPSPTTNSEIVTKIRSLGLHARLVLLSLLLATKRLEAGLPLSSTSGTSSPVKRGAGSTPAVGGVDPAQLHAFYIAILSRSCDGVFSPVSRSEFGDLVGMLEGVGLVLCPSSTGLPAAASSSLGGKAKRAFGRSASFGFGANRGAGDVQLASAVRTDEVLRGLGIHGVDEAVDEEDVAAEEVNAIWVKENARLARDTTARDNKAKKDSNKACAGFDDAMED
ncbi:AAA domain-containing protein [Mycena sanguinolenta]|uniref:AAA domain-containing protein n=1 Tax=Mycena sanguinolenta TaxID=230812 RepID=A0A8H7DI93_9AGAR|nr:AAA domain-containing protein [Mycena sanguinolenta]